MMELVNMTLFSSFSERGPNKIFISMLLGALAGFSYSMLIPIILNSISKDSGMVLQASAEMFTIFSIKISNHQFALLFVLTCVVILVSRTLSQVLMVRVALDVTAAIRLKLYRRIFKAPTDELEKLGSSKILAVLTRDVEQVVDGASEIPSLLVNAMTLIGLLSFLLYLNSQVFVLVIVAIVVGGTLYQIPMMIATRFFKKLRQDVDTLYEGMRGLIYGNKELKLNQRKRNVYYDDILIRGENNLKSNGVKGETIARAGVSFGDLISFFVIGIVAFILVSYFTITTQTLVGTVMALLYITGPISVIMNAVPRIARARISLNRVNDFTARMSKEDAVQNVFELPSWSSVVYKDVYFQYDNAANGFKLGPINLELKKGEITFIVGGNGSGKSTLSKLISLHYPSKGGSISFGETLVCGETVNSCRDTLSMIFPDFYLFDRLLGQLENEHQDKIDFYLKELKLENKVTIENGFFSTIALSDGQKKRLALLVEFIEDKEMYLFDEWAADQDPIFKKVFYYKLLPELKARGKVVVVISHDDRYFDVADKVVVMEDGKMSTVRSRSTIDETEKKEVVEFAV